MKSNTALLFSLSLFLYACGGGSSSSDTNNDTPPPPPVQDQTPKVSFSLSDAPADSITSVNVTFESITLKSADDNEDDDSGLLVPILDDSDNPTTLTIDLMDYQDGETKLIIEGAEIAPGSYSNLILNTSGCPQNHNGSTEFCWVEDSDGTKTLKTPSNKLKLGAFTVSDQGEQAYTIEFNLRSSLVSTAGGAGYNLKPHGIRIVDDAMVGSVAGMVDVNLLTAGESCETVFDEDTDHGKIVYLYEGMLADEAMMGDEFDPAEAQNEIPETVVAPFASDTITYDADNDTYHYTIAQLPAGEYTIAFSCSAVGDDPEEYDALMIANPSEQVHELTIEAETETTVNFTEIN
ncbi:DUF4382 domain-containing protein [Thalassotalea fusca]